MSILVQNLLNKSESLPTIPRIVSELLVELDKDDPDLRKMVTLVKTDPVLMAKILKLSNSALFSLNKEVCNVDMAMQLLGLSHLRALITAVAISSSFKLVPGMKLDSFWRYSLNTAKMSQALGRYLRLNDGLCFTIGLLHCIGELVLNIAASKTDLDKIKHISYFSQERYAAEKDVFGFSFDTVTSLFLEHWKFPKFISETIKYQSDPLDSLDNKYVFILSLSIWRARHLEINSDPQKLEIEFPLFSDFLDIDFQKFQEIEPQMWSSKQEISLFVSG